MNRRSACGFSIYLTLLRQGNRIVKDIIIQIFQSLFGYYLACILWIIVVNLNVILDLFTALERWCSDGRYQRDYRL